jgi:hypothetical protein
MYDSIQEETAKLDRCVFKYFGVKKSPVNMGPVQKLWVCWQFENKMKNCQMLGILIKSSTTAFVWVPNMH